MKTNDVFISGGLGDCLLHTPLIETLFNLFNKRINVFTNQVNHFELLQNNPYCDINLEKSVIFYYIKFGTKIVKYSTINAPLVTCLQRNGLPNSKNIINI